MNRKCDIVIPVYNAPEWIDPCLEAVFRNTPGDVLGKIILVDDASGPETKKILERWRDSNSQIELAVNPINKGFIESVNCGLELTVSSDILLLNSDCLLSPDAIPRLMAHAGGKEKVGLVSPVSNNSPVVTLDIYMGYSYLDMHALFSGICDRESAPACTIVGNCLLITRECYAALGPLDTAYGKGYGEETDYQFRAHKAGFEASIAMDCYVYHKAEASFGSAAEMDARRKKNHALFMSRWGQDYQQRMEQYKKNDPIEKMRARAEAHFQKHPVLPEYDILFFLPGIGQTAGGIHVVVEIVNALVLSGIRAMIYSPAYGEYMEKKYFNFLVIPGWNSVAYSGIKADTIVATLYSTVGPCFEYSRLSGSRLLYFVQGPEIYFRNGASYGEVEETYRMADGLVSVSEWLTGLLKDRFSKDAVTLPNGYDEFTFYPATESRTREITVLTMVLRGSGDVQKGDWVLEDLLRLLLNRYPESLEIRVIHNEDIVTCSHGNSVKFHRLPLSKKAISSILRETDIFVDASFFEGFGLFPLEAMASGAVCIVSDSGGVREFLDEGINGILIGQVNQPHAYLSAVSSLIDDRKKMGEMRQKSLETAARFTLKQTLARHIGFWNDTAKRVPVNTKNWENFPIASRLFLKNQVPGNLPVMKSGTPLKAPRQKIALKEYVRILKARIRAFMNPQKPVWHLDVFLKQESRIILSGWIFIPKTKITKVLVTVNGSGKSEKAELFFPLERGDVYQLYRKQNAYHCGFSGDASFEGNWDQPVLLAETADGKTLSIQLGLLH